jgi:hypothetical protein
MFAGKRFEGWLIHTERGNCRSIADVVQPSGCGGCGDRAVFVARAMECGDNDRCWGRCGNAAEIRVERHRLCVKEHWRGEIRICTARQITAAMCHWQRPK